MVSTQGRSILRVKPPVVKGDPRSDVSTNDELDSCSQLRRGRVVPPGTDACSGCPLGPADMRNSATQISSDPPARDPRYRGEGHQKQVARCHHTIALGHRSVVDFGVGQIMGPRSASIDVRMDAISSTHH